MDATSTNARKPCFSARLCAELKRLIVLSAVVGLLLIAGKYYWFDRLDEEIRRHVENNLRSHYTGLNISVRSARRVVGRGVEIRGLRIADSGPEGQTIAEIDEIFAECDTRLPDFLTQPLSVTAYRVHRLKLRAERDGAGAWNLSKLLPLPPTQRNGPPVATITDSLVEIIDPRQNPPCAWALRGIELVVQPQSGPTATESDDTASPTPQLTNASITGASPATLLHIRGTLSGDHVEQVEVDGLLNPTTGEWDLRGAVEGLEFNPRLRAALPREVNTALAPLSSIRGRTHFGFHVQHTSAPQGGQQRWQGPEGIKPLPGIASATGSQSDNSLSIQFLIHGRISEGRVDDTRLPEPLTDVEATIRCDNQGVLIQNLSARCGTTKLEVGATLSGYSGTQPMDIELVAYRLQLERLPIAALSPALRDTWRRFNPRGTADVSGRLHFDGRQWQPNLTIDCHNLSLLYEKFPYQLTDGSGKIVMRPDAVSAQLDCQGGGQIVHCRANIQQPGKTFTGTIDVSSDGPIPIDEKLLTAMEGPTQQVVRAFRPRGMASFQAHFQRDVPTAILHRRVAVQLHDCSIQHERFSYPIDKLEGLLESTDDRWLFRNLKGRNDSAVIVGEGLWQDTPSGRQLTLQLTATDVPLADELRQALPEGPRRLWANLRPRGNIDHVAIGLKYDQATRNWTINIQADKGPASSGVASRTITLEPAWFPYRLDNVTGQFLYGNGQMELKNLRATHGLASVSAEGICQIASPGGSSLELTHLAADRIVIDQELLDAMPAGLRRSLARVPIDGPLDLIGKFKINVPNQEGAKPQLEWDLSLDMENGRLATPTPVEHLHGGMRLIGRDGSEGFFSRGELQIDSLFLKGLQFTSLEGPFWFDGSRIVFGSLANANTANRLPRQVTARLLDGLISLDGEAELGPEGRFQLQATLENADLADFARELAPHQRRLSGRVFGLVHLSGNAQGMHSWRGDGQMRLRDADIYELPAMITLLKILSIRQPDKTAFTTSNIDFRIEGDDLVFDRIDFSGDAISLKGKGRMTRQREIDLQFYPIVGREERQLLIFRPLLGETGREFMLIEVTGTIDQPNVQRSVFPRVDARLQALFPELARDELIEPIMPNIPTPREVLKGLSPFPRR